MFYGWISLIILISCTRNLANTFNIERVNEQQVNKQSTIRLKKKKKKKRNQLHIPDIFRVTGETSGGDIELISQSVSGYEIEPLIEETVDMKEKVTSLLEKLKNKK